MGKFIPDALIKLFAANASNFRSVDVALDERGAAAGLDKPHRLVHYLAQLAHESGNFRLDREAWGPTAAQKRYDTRVDLGNTPEADGDGEKYLGRTAIQITGRANYAAFRDWCTAQTLNPPDFVEDPDVMNTDPWEGLAPIWFWSTHGLNALADANDIEQITKRINGGLTGYADRVAQYTRIGLVLCGFAPGDIAGFQTAAKVRGFYEGDIDADSGPKTRAAVHKWLSAPVAAEIKVAAAPVVEPKPVAVAPKGAEKTGIMRLAGAVAAAGPAVAAALPHDDRLRAACLAIGFLAVLVLLWRGEMIASRVKAVLASFEE